MSEASQARADQRYWKEWIAPFNAVLCGFSFRHSATFEDEVGTRFRVSGPLLRIVDALRADLARVTAERDEARRENLGPDLQSALDDFATVWAVRAWMTPDDIELSREKFKEEVLTAFCRIALPYKNAFARIAELERLLGEAVDGLRPFAKEFASWDAEFAQYVDDDLHPVIAQDTSYTTAEAEFTFGELRRAAAIVAKAEGGPDAA